MVFASNHWHALLRVQDAQQLAKFMQYVDGNLALEVNRLVDWPHGTWSRRYQAIVVSNEEEAQVGRLKYLLAHGVKEGLVARVEEWPGVHSAGTLLHGRPLEGYWFDRTQEYAARNRGEDFGVMKYATREELVLSPLPCWEHLPSELYREQVADLIEQIEAEGRAERESKGVQPLGMEAILRQNPTIRPSKTKKSPAPRIHAASKAVRKGFWEAYCAFVAAFREAAERLKAGDRLARFPEGSFPPAMPFVSPFPARPP